MQNSSSKFSLLIYLTFFVHKNSSKELLDYLPHNFFPTDDVTEINWGHGINSEASLKAALADPLMRMIEADLCRGRLNRSGMIDPFDIVIMAHPPDNTSDLSFTSFIDQIIEFNKGKSLEEMKGVKLDFKDSFASTRSILLLGARNRTVNGTDPALPFPVWLNADVVKGPVNSTSEPKVNGVDLLNLHEKNLPNAVLSLGWTTSYKDGGFYTREHVDDMIQVFRNFSRDITKTSQIPVTFAVRAAVGQNSLGNLLYLLNSTSYKSSITFWGGADDPKVNVTLMDDFLKLVGKQRTFIDLPYTDWKASSGKSISYSIAFLLFATLMRYFCYKLFI